jgi:transposase
LSHSFLSHSEPNFAFLRPFPPYYAATKPQKGRRIKKTTKNKTFRKRGSILDFKQQGARKGKRQSIRKDNFPLLKTKKVAALTVEASPLRLKFILPFGFCINPIKQVLYRKKRG